MTSASDVAQARIHTDFNGLAALRRSASEDPAAAVDAVARQFEALFLQQILEQMRTTSLGEDVMGGDSVDQYTEMMHQQLALEIAQGEGLGLREVLTRQLSALPGVGASGDETSISAERARFEMRTSP